MLMLAERQGVVVSSVKDGHILLFKRQSLQDILDKNPDADKISIFVKKPTLENN